MDNLIFQLVIFLILFSIGWAFGRHIERKHLNELLEKEQQFAHIRIDTNRFATSDQLGHFIVERARREAIVRLKQQAQSVGANHIMGVRLSTTELGMQGGMVEAFAYGTAVKD